MFLLVFKSDTTIGVSVGTRSEIPEELRNDWPLVEAMARDSLAWYAEQGGGELVGPVHWSLHMLGNPWLSPPIEEGVWQ